MVPGFESFKEDNANGSTLHCSDLEPSLFEAVIDHYTTRFPVREISKKIDEALTEALGYFNTRCAANGHKSRCTDDDGNEDGALNADGSITSTSTRKLYSSGEDPTFIVGADKTEVKVNCAILAAMIPVIKRMLYGVGTITGADETKPIVWPDFDGESVCLVFDALRQRDTWITVLNFP
jgi:hypothetical protein